MKRALAGLVPLAFVFAAGCASAQPADSCTPSSGNGQHTICLRQVEGKAECEVDPPRLVIESGDEVTFVAAGANAADVKIRRKHDRPSLQFAGGEPGVIRNGSRHGAGKVTGEPGQEWVYGVKFRRGPFKKGVCEVDPEICIKGQGCSG